MQCREARHLLVALSDGEVAPSEQVQLTEHLATCSACRAQFERLDSLFPRADLYVPPDVTRRLWNLVRATPVLAKVREAVPAHRPQSSSRVVGLASGVALGLLLAAVWAGLPAVPTLEPEVSPLVQGPRAEGVDPEDPRAHTGLWEHGTHRVDGTISPVDWRPASFNPGTASGAADGSQR